MKIPFVILLLLTIICSLTNAQWLPDSILNDNNRMCRTGNNGARGITSSGNELYAVWIEDVHEIFLKAKIGGTWTSSERVSVGSPNGLYGISTYPSIELYASDIHVVWEDFRTGDFEIFYRKFSGGWGSPTNLSGTLTESHAPVITVTNSGNIYLVWQDYSTEISEIYAKRYSNGNWGATERISSTTFYAGFPTITSYGEAVYVVWEETENSGYELYFSRHSGGSWSNPQRITNNEGLSQSPSLCTDPSGTLHLVWSDDTNDHFEVFYSSFNGSTWSNPIPVSNNPGFALYPQVTSDPYGVIHLVWSDDREGNYDIFHKSRTSGLWSSEENISNREKQSTSPHVVCTNDGGVHVIWYDWVDDSVYVSPHIRYKQYDPTLKILSSSFSYAVTDSGIHLHASLSHPHVSLYRIDTPYPVKIPLLSFDGDRYEWFDRLPPGRYHYILQRSDGGKTHYSHPVEITIPERVDRFHVMVSPNPFIEKVEIRLNGNPGDQCIGEPVIYIYDITGREVRSYHIPTSQFPISVVWDGKGSDGRSTPSGVYFIRSQYTPTRSVLKM
jgi:hypothetical protein